MKAFLEEYGLAIFAMICIILLILIASPISSMISTALQGIVTSFSGKTTSVFNTIQLPTFTVTP